MGFIFNICEHLLRLSGFFSTVRLCIPTELIYDSRCDWPERMVRYLCSV